MRLRTRLLLAVCLCAVPDGRTQTPSQPPYEACKPGDFTVIGYPDEVWPKRDGRFRVLIDRRFQGEFLTPERIWMPSIESAINRFNDIAGAGWRFDVESLTRVGPSPLDGALTIAACGYTFPCPGALPNPPGTPPPYNPPTPPIPVPATTLAVTLVYSETGGRREILDSDIYFNPLVPYSVNPNGGQIDFESVLAHELGHALGLGHNDNCVASPTVMESVIDLGQIGRRLQPPELEGIRFLYPDGQVPGVRIFARDQNVSFESATGKPPRPRDIPIYGPGGWRWTAVVSPGAATWLQMHPSYGAFPADGLLTLAPNVIGLAPGEYSGTVRVTADGYAGGSIEVHVRLGVAAPPQGVPAFSRQSVVNAGNTSSEAVAPGGLFTIFGTNLANTTAAAGGFPLPALLAGTEVLVDGIPAALVYVSPTQINAQAPPEVAPGVAGISVRNGTAASATVPVELAASAPELFLGAGGRAVILNQDGTLNTAANPATRGSIVTVFLTGLGAVSPPIPSGRPAPFEPLARAVAVSHVEIAGQDAEVHYLGLTPGFAGLGQANVKIPDGSAGDLRIRITSASHRSESGVISVR